MGAGGSVGGGGGGSVGGGSVSGGGSGLDVYGWIETAVFVGIGAGFDPEPPEPGGK